MPYTPSYTWDGSAYHGASLAALDRLCSAHGYALVGCDSAGVNAFFVHRDELGDHFPDHALGLDHFRCLTRTRGFGYSPCSPVGDS